MEVVELIKAATHWPTNADMIVDVVALGYLHHGMRVLDPTYGRGRWWTKWEPDWPITKNDWDTSTGAQYCHDFRHFPRHWAGCYDAITFDPPYVSTGGRKTSTISDFNKRFGLIEAPSTPLGVAVMINDGITELNRLLKPGGYLLVKCKNYVSSGKLFPGVHYVWQWATQPDVLGPQMTYVDELTMVGIPGAQSQTRQVHARQNTSTLFVFKKGK